MVTLVLAPLALAVFGMPQQLGKQRAQPPPVVHQLFRQVAAAPLASVDASAVVLERPGKPLRIELPPQTPITRGGHPLDRSALHPGLLVRISYDVVNGPPKANWIEVIAPPARTP
jgi:hypothetical protein